MKPLIVGQSPSRGMEGHPPFSDASGRRLRQLAGLDHPLADTFDLVNLLQFYPGKKVKGDRFWEYADPVQLGRYQIMNYYLTCSPRWVLIMGRNVERAILRGRGKKWPFCEPRWVNFMRSELVPEPESMWLNHRVIVFPHPSSIVMWWNDPANVALARKWLHRIVAEPQPRRDHG